MDKIGSISIVTITVLILLITFVLIFFFHFKKHKNSISNSFLEEEEKNQKYIDFLQKQIEKLRKNYKTSLEKLYGYKFYEIEKEIEKDLKIDLDNYKNEKIMEIDHQINQHKNAMAKTIILNAIETNCLKVTNETSTSYILLNDENIKAKFIGKKGKNINFFKKTTKVDVIIEKEPYILLSCPNPIRKQIAINTVKHMIKSNAFDENAITNIFKKEKAKLLISLDDIGEQYVNKLKLKKINENLYTYIGRLQYRSSYSQNVLEHCYETAIIARKIAKQLKLNEDLATMCGFFHDIGKSIDYDFDYDHVAQGIELAKKYHLPKEVIDTIAHHHDQIFPNAYVTITKISDTISAGRKGARTISEIGFKQAKIAEDICKKNISVGGVYTISGTNFLKIIIIPKRNYFNRLSEVKFDLLNALKKNKNFTENNVEVIFSNIKEKKINP